MSAEGYPAKVHTNHISVNSIWFAHCAGKPIARNRYIPASSSASSPSYPERRMDISKGKQATERHERTFEFLNSSITRRSYGENPATSRTTERTNFVRADWMPLRWLGRTVFSMGVVAWPLLRPVRMSKEHHNVSITLSKAHSDGMQTHWCGPFSWILRRTALAMALTIDSGDAEMCGAT